MSGFVYCKYQTTNHSDINKISFKTVLWFVQTTEWEVSCNCVLVVVIFAYVIVSIRFKHGFVIHRAAVLVSTEKHCSATAHGLSTLQGCSCHNNKRSF